MAKKYWLSAILTLVVLSSSMYFLFDMGNNQLRFDIQETRSQFYLCDENGRNCNDLLGTEYVYLYDGSAKMRASDRGLTQWQDDNFVYAYRNATYKDGIFVEEMYTIDKATTDVELFPLSHLVKRHEAYRVALQ